MTSKGQVLLLYRQILRAAKHFPSIKRMEVIRDIKAEFKDHKILSDPVAIRREMEVGIRSLGQLQAYSGMKTQDEGGDWVVYLKGPCE